MRASHRPTCPDLLELARGGDEQAFGSLFEAATPRLLLYVKLRLGGRLAGKLDALDVLQETALEAFRSMQRFEPRGAGSFSHWLCGIAENRMRDLAKLHGAAKRGGLEVSEPLTRVLERVRRSQAGPLTAADRGERIERVNAALQQLEPQEREALVLRFFQGAKLDEIARTMGRSESAVRRLLGRSALRMGQLLEPSS